MQYCHNQQHHAVGAIGPIIANAFGQDHPAGLDEAITQQIVNGVSGIMAKIGRDLDIKRDALILDDLKTRKVYAAGLGKEWDVFLCHASEDKLEFVRPLATALQASGLIVWYDEFTLKVGDGLRQKIDEGLAHSRFGIVVLSRAFFAKNWPQRELDGLMTREIAGTKVILPVWHGVSFDDVSQESPMLAGLVAARSEEGLDVVVHKLRQAMGL